MRHLRLFLVGILLACCASLCPGCATPISDQANDAGSEARAPFYAVTINLGTGGNVGVTGSSSPAAAPSTSSADTATQRADAKAEASIPAEAIKTLAGGEAVDAAAKVVKKVVEPEPPAPAPVE